MPDLSDGERSYDEKKEAVAKLRNLMKVNEKLNNLKSDDAYLERFLYAKNFDVNEAYNTMKMFYELLEECPEWFSLGSPADQRELIEKNIRILTNGHDKEGRIIYIVKIGNMNPSKMNLLDIIAVDDYCLETTLISDHTVCQKGLCVIVDIADFSLNLMRWLTPTNIQISLRRIFSMPIKDYRFHVVNNAFFVNVAIKFMWPFLPQHVKDSSKFHFNDRNSLYDYIDREVLPEEYGGENHIDYENCQSIVYESQDEIIESFRNNRICFLDSVLSDKNKNKRFI